MKFFGILLTVAVLLFLSACPANSSEQTNANISKELVVYTYDSFASEWGPGPAVFKAFELKTGIKVRVEAPADANTIVLRLIAEQKAPQADIALGLDGVLAIQAKAAGVIEAYVPKGLEDLDPVLRFDNDLLVPYDFGYFGIVYDSETLKNPPNSLEDLTKAEYKGQLILLDPRSSSPGLGFLTWTMMVYGENWPNYWQRLRPNILTVAPGWSEGYGAFTKGEASMVLSYTTSPAYHKEFEQSERYRAAIFKDGHVIQVEGAGMVKGAPHTEAAKAFLDFILTPEFQDHLALSNFMFPARSTGDLPASFAIVPKVLKVLKVENQLTSDKITQAQDQWLRLMAE